MTTEITLVSVVNNKTEDLSSLNDGMNMRIHEAIKPARNNGTVISRNALSGFAPRMRALSSSSGWMLVSAALLV